MRLNDPAGSEPSEEIWTKLEKNGKLNNKR